MNYRETRNMQNQNRAIFDGVGQYDIPFIAPCNADGLDNCEWIPFNYAKTCKNPSNKILHFYLDDYQFERLWSSPESYINLFSKFKAITSPDFSLYIDYPKALQIYNHFRKHWLGAYYQLNGITVIPTICWSDYESYNWCFDGEPRYSAVTISDIGCMNNKLTKKAFMQGFQKACDILCPTKIYLLTNNQSIERFDDGSYNYFDAKKIKTVKSIVMQRLKGIKSDKRKE